MSVFGVGLVEDRKAGVFSDLRGAFQGDSRAVIGGFGGSLEVSSPVLLDAPGRPRAFAHFDTSFMPEPEEPVINEGAPGPLDIETVAGTSQRPIAGVQGRGSATRVQMQPWVLSAGAGVSIGLEAFGRSVRLKPSLEWRWQEEEVRALLGAAESENPANPNFCAFPLGCRTLFIDEKEAQDFHWLGPGFELEVDAVRLDDWMFSVYVTSHVYRVLGDRRVEVHATGTWLREDGTPSARAPSSMTSTYELDPWSYRVGMGLRIAWRPR